MSLGGPAKVIKSVGEASVTPTGFVAWLRVAIVPPAASEPFAVRSSRSATRDVPARRPQRNRRARSLGGGHRRAKAQHAACGEGENSRNSRGPGDWGCHGWDGSRQKHTKGQGAESPQVFYHHATSSKLDYYLGSCVSEIFCLPRKGRMNKLSDTSTSSAGPMSRSRSDRSISRTR